MGSHQTYNACPAKRRMDLVKVNKWTRAKLAARLRQGVRLCSRKKGGGVQLLVSSLAPLLGRARIGFVDELTLSH